MSARIYFRTLLEGDVSGSLQNLDGQTISDGDASIVITVEGLNVVTYFYKLDANSGAAHNPPDVIIPLMNANNKRWILSDVYGAAEGGGGGGIEDLTGFTTDDLSEGANNLYFTVGRVEGVFPDTNSLSEGTINLYHTEARVITIVNNMGVLVPDVNNEVAISEIDLPTISDYKVNGVGLNVIINQMIDAKL